MSRPELHRPAGMSDGDAELLSSARSALEAVYREGRHEVASAFRLGDGRIVTGVHVDGSARRSAVCAEGVAAGNAVAALAGSTAAGVVAVVSVLRRPVDTWHVIEPCGVCAELLTDYWPEARVWIGRGDAVVVTRAADLLPAKLSRIW